MLGLAEYTVLSTDLWQQALISQQKINTALAANLTKQQAIKVTQQFAKEYVQAYRGILDSGLQEIAGNAIDYYQAQLGFEVANPEQVVSALLKDSYKSRYYGVTLERRLAINEQRLMRNIGKAALWGAEYEGLKRLLTHPVPYGAQFNFDKRILLAQSVKIEQDVAKVMGDQANIVLVKWNVSALHPKPDICDEYATYQSKSVVKYIEDNRLDINPKGVYFLNELPPPPHPNCMCEYGLVQGKRVTGGPVKRTISKIRNLLQRFRSK